MPGFAAYYLLLVFQLMFYPAAFSKQCKVWAVPLLLAMGAQVSAVVMVDVRPCLFIIMHAMHPPLLLHSICVRC
jgi:hypothetical protein